MPTGNKATLTSLHSPFTVSPTEYSVGVTGDSALTTDEVIDLWAWKGVSENAWERFQSKKYFRTHSLSHSLTLTHTHSHSVSQSVSPLQRPLSKVEWYEYQFERSHCFGVKVEWG